MKRKDLHKLYRRFNKSKREGNLDASIAIQIANELGHKLEVYDEEIKEEDMELNVIYLERYKVEDYSYYFKTY